ncbi:histidine triad nucleotide-binding protein [Olsenella profusa]|uniref:Histidine triad nucleotide-binding protein n=1 Tax=Olsenella profusa TaxID=138595 RepID=A0ABS2EZA4_9ACTN|nr:histidine triad nucleotide-binding protein [Olsenella profusa]MBM6774054.1 histidine triad nucleotide-binding protein [Olsenella profusa]
MSDCIFCKLANGEIPTEFLFEDDNVVAFRDTNPQAPVHVLVVPKAHYDNFVDGVPAETLASMEAAVRAVTERCGIAESGFRCIMNTGAAAGQTVMHLHMHVLGGCDLGEGLLPA